MPEYSGQTVTLVSEDEKQFEVPVEVASQSVIIKHMIEDLGQEQMKTPIPVPNVSSKILEKLLQFCTHNYENPPTYREDITEWEKEFCNVEHPVLFELISAANFLDVKHLLDVTCKTVSNIMRGKSPELIRKTLNIKNDFTPEEEEQVERENDWCEER